MLQLLFFGRLETEKGRKSIVDMIEHFADGNTDRLPFVLHIFGQGSYEQTIETLAQQFPQHIIYYGFEPLGVIRKVATQCDYCLMPSLFLETFGLSAVNALARGLPVVGYKQGGMTPFVIDRYNLASNPGSPSVQLIEMMNTLLAQGTDNETKACLNIAKQYSKKQWINRFDTLINTSCMSPSSLSRNGQKKKILLVTDFTSKIGGIETYIYDVAQALREQGHTVTIIGGEGGRTRIGRLLCMLVSIYNIFFASQLKKTIKDFAPDIIRCHSILRYVGWLPLAVINNTQTTKRMMYHDLGYFHPFPHKATTEAHISGSIDWKIFSQGISNPILLFFVRGKWLLLKKIQKQLKQFDKHLVPSAFMQTAVVHNYSHDVDILAHFIQD